MMEHMIGGALLGLIVVVVVCGVWWTIARVNWDYPSPRSVKVKITYLYKGVLSPGVGAAIARDASKGYHFWIELYEIPAMYQWANDNLPLYDSTGEDCMGGIFRKKSHMYVIVDGKFLAFKTMHEKELFVRDFTRYIASTNPFKTEVSR